MKDIEEELEDVSESIEEVVPKKKPRMWGKNGFKAGVSGNTAGRTKGVRNLKPRSKMRTTLYGLYQMQPEALVVIKEALKVKSKEEKALLDKDRVDAAKFVIKAIESLNNSCLKEELIILGLREKNEENAEDIEDNQSSEEEAPVSRFSMTMLPKPEDLH